MTEESSSDKSGLPGAGTLQESEPLVIVIKKGGLAKIRKLNVLNPGEPPPESSPLFLGNKPLPDAQELSGASPLASVGTSAKTHTQTIKVPVSGSKDWTPRR